MNKLVLFLGLLFCIFSLTLIIGERIQIIELEQGKNNFTLDSGIDLDPVYAKTLIEKNPEIISISYIDKTQNISIGYLNVFGGIGTNFILTENQTYEIISKQKITLYLTS